MAEIQPKGDSGGGGKKRAKKASTKIDMTPMVDLGFLLLTFFILTTTFAKPQVMEINMPVKEENKDDRNELKASNAFTVLLGTDNKVYYYQGLHQPGINVVPELIESNWSASGIRKTVLEADRENAANNNGKSEMMVLIKAEETSSYENLVDILDEMAITSISKYAIVDLDPADAGLLRRKQRGE